MKTSNFAERQAVHILSSWAFTEGVKAEPGTTGDMPWMGTEWWEIFCSVRDAIDKYLDGREPTNDEETDAVIQAGVNALPAGGAIKSKEVRKMKTEDARITEELAAVVNTWQPIPHEERGFAEKTAVRIVVGNTERKLDLNWTERFDIAYEAIRGVVAERKPNNEEVGRAIRAAKDALSEAYPESSLGILAALSGRG